MPIQEMEWLTLPAGDWAIVELFGHTTLVGRIGEVERFGTKMLALEPLFNGHLMPAVFHGGAAIYRLTPCSPKVAWENQPRQSYQLPATIRAVTPDLLLVAPDGSANGNQCQLNTECCLSPGHVGTCSEYPF